MITILKSPFNFTYHFTSPESPINFYQSCTIPAVSSILSYLFFYWWSLYGPNGYFSNFSIKLIVLPFWFCFSFWVRICYKTKWVRNPYSTLAMFLLTLIRVGFLGLRFAVEGFGGKITTHPFLKLVRITLETWNLVLKYTSICSVRKYTL